MEHEEGDLLGLEVSQLGCIDDLINENRMIDHNIITNPLNIDTSKLLSGENLDDQLGLNQKEELLDGFLERFQQQLEINNDIVDLSISADANLVSDHTIFAPRNVRKKPRRWTKQEQSQFRKALENGYWGKWKEVSELYIPSKTPSQITSHAQKYALRKNNTHKKRKSINDDDDTHEHVNTVDHHHQPHVLHGPSSSSSSSSLSMVNYDQMCSPVHGNGMMMNDDMPPAALYYANKCMQLEKQISMLLKLKRRGMIMRFMTMPAPINGFLPEPGYSASNAPFGVKRPLQPYVGTSSSHHYHDAYYNNAPQGLQHQPLVDQQITHHGHPPDHAYY